MSKKHFEGPNNTCSARCGPVDPHRSDTCRIGHCRNLCSTSEGRAQHSAFMPKLLHAIILGLASVRSLSTTRRRIIIAPAATALPLVALPALAEDDEAARAAALQAKLAERRKLMELSRSSNDRQRYFDLSRQRASVVYNTTYQGASCVPGLPCI